MDREQMIAHLALQGWAPTSCVGAWHIEHGTIWCNRIGRDDHPGDTGRSWLDRKRTFYNGDATNWNGITDFYLEMIFTHATERLYLEEVSYYGP